MANLRVVLRKKKNKVGKFPIAIRITKDCKSSFLNTGQYMDEKFWDERNRNVGKSHPNAKVLSNFIMSKVAETNEKVLKSEMKPEYESVAEIRNKIIEKKGFHFFIVANMHLQNLKKRNKHHQYDTEFGCLKEFKEFSGKDVLPFNMLNVALLKKFGSHLLHSKKPSLRTVVNYLILIKTTYNHCYFRIYNG